MNFIIHITDETSYYRESNGIFGKEKIKDEKEEIVGETLLSDAFYLSCVNSKDPIDAVIECANIVEMEDETGKISTLASIIGESKQKEKDEEYTNILRAISPLESYEQTTSSVFSHHFFLTKEDDDGIYYEYHRVFFYSIEEGKIMKVVDKENDEV